MEEVMSELYGVWFLIGAALVFWMQAGFAMVETGFTRAKNAGNILMKNLMDFCIGTVVFIIIGFSLLLGEDLVGLIGKPGFDIFTSYENFDWSNFVFNQQRFYMLVEISQISRVVYNNDVQSSPEGRCISWGTIRFMTGLMNCVSKGAGVATSW